MSSSFEDGIILAILYEDNVKVSTIENESESAEARGGQGNNKLMSWDFGRTASLTMQDALLSDASLSLLAGTAVKSSGIKVVGRDVAEVASGLTVELQNLPIKGSISVFQYKNGLLGEEVTLGEDLDPMDTSVLLTGVAEGEMVMAFYEYEVAQDVSQITFSGDAFPATYKVVGDTVVRGEDGVDRKMQFRIPKAKLQSAFSLTMDVENVSTFDFNLDILTESGTKTLYEIVRIGKQQPQA